MPCGGTRPSDTEVVWIRARMPNLTKKSSPTAAICVRYFCVVSRRILASSGVTVPCCSASATAAKLSAQGQAKIEAVDGYLSTLARPSARSVCRPTSPRASTGIERSQGSRLRRSEAELGESRHIRPSMGKHEIEDQTPER
jgi:hypothetical protein